MLASQHRESNRSSGGISTVPEKANENVHCSSYMLKTFNICFVEESVKKIFEVVQELNPQSRDCMQSNFCAI
jgi:hypothetical protein